MANHITQWKPTVTIKVRYSKPQTTSFSTYRELVRNMRLLLNRSIDNEVFVSRSKRGQWGEWFEYWRMSEPEFVGDKIVNKPYIFKQGWM